MRGSASVGRIGGLAVALGIGAAAFSSGGIAWAEPTESSSSSTSDASDSGPPVRTVSRGPRLGAVSSPTGARKADDENSRKTSLKRPRVGAGGLDAFAPKKNRPSSTANAAIGSSSDVSRAETEDSSGASHEADVTTESVAAPRPILQTPTRSPDQRPPIAISKVVKRLVSVFTGNSPVAPPADPPAASLLLAAARREHSGAIAAPDAPSTTATKPTFVLNGYNVTPSSPLDVISFYGLFTSTPALPGTVQGTQKYDVVDPETSETVGRFDAVVSLTNSFIFRNGTYQEIYVTSVDDDADSSDTPPKGTLIASYQFGRNGRFGVLYTSTPSESGNVNSFEVRTPRGGFAVPWKYDGGLVFTSVSIPLELTDDYYIAPKPGSPETIMSISGVTPLFTAVQGEQEFNVYQRVEGGDDVVRGSFIGYVTTTSDFFLASTEAILVTKVTSGIEGTGPGDVPPPGAIYNVIYGFGIFYSAIPSDSGDVITATLSLPLIGKINLPIKWNAIKVPYPTSLSVPGEYDLIPLGDLTPVGVNGLPPREVQIQGYQQFDVIGKDGHRMGNFHADVTVQHGILGFFSESILVTEVNDVTGSGDVPPVGSQLNFWSTPIKGFGIFYSAVPSASGSIITLKVLTPFGDITLPIGYDAITGLEDVTYSRWAPWRNRTDPTQAKRIGTREPREIPALPGVLSS